MNIIQWFRAGFTPYVFPRKMRHNVAQRYKELSAIKDPVERKRQMREHMLGVHDFMTSQM